jgi:hypothetical protein
MDAEKENKKVLTNSTCQSWKDLISDKYKKQDCLSSIEQDEKWFQLYKQKNLSS